MLWADDGMVYNNGSQSCRVGRNVKIDKFYHMYRLTDVHNGTVFKRIILTDRSILDSDPRTNEVYCLYSRNNLKPYITSFIPAINRVLWHNTSDSLVRSVSDRIITMIGQQFHEVNEYPDNYEEYYNYINELHDLIYNFNYHDFAQNYPALTDSNLITHEHVEREVMNNNYMDNANPCVDRADWYPDVLSRYIDIYSPVEDTVTNHFVRYITMANGVNKQPVMWNDLIHFTVPTCEIVFNSLINMHVPFCEHDSDVIYHLPTTTLIRSEQLIDVMTGVDGAVYMCISSGDCVFKPIQPENTAIMNKQAVPGDIATTMEVAAMKFATIGIHKLEFYKTENEDMYILLHSNHEVVKIYLNLVEYALASRSLPNF